MESLKGRTVVVGVTGGIAAYKSCELVSRLRKAGAGVHVIMTHNACRFVAPLTFETLSNHPCITDTFDRPEQWEVEHVALAKAADLMVIAPCTANMMAKLCHGLADDMLSTTALACHAPMLLAPAMNTGMWEAEATRQNLAALQARGVAFIGPEGGQLACGDSGTGRMSEPEAIAERCAQMLNPRLDLAGKKILVTAGPTREKLDPVRYITNRSSGKMGYAIAERAARRGAAVTLVTGPVALQPPAGVKVIAVESTAQLAQAVLAEVPNMDAVVQSAAPADYTPESVAEQKIKKQGDDGLTLRLIPTTDVARQVGLGKKPGQVLVGFAAETERLLENAQKKRLSKNLDLLVANDVTRPGAGFDVDTNIVSFLDAEGIRELPLMQKTEVADRILDRVAELLRAADVRADHS